MECPPCCNELHEYCRGGGCDCDCADGDLVSVDVEPIEPDDADLWHDGEPPRGVVEP